MDKFERIDRKVVHKGNIIDYCVDDIITPDGKKVNFDFIAHKGAAAVVPVLDNGDIVMVRQWRNAIDKYTLEIPAGGLNTADEPTFDCASRELTEETGYHSDNIELLKTIYTTVAFCNEKIDIYVAHDLIPGKQNLDPDEFINIETYSIDELIDMVYNNEICDCKTAVAILAYYVKFCANK